MNYRRDEALRGIMPQGDFLLYLLGTFSVLLGTALLMTSLYLLPYFLFQLAYPIPDYVLELYAWLQMRRQMEGALMALLLLGPPMIIAVVFYYIAGKVTEKLEIRKAHYTHDHEGEATQRSDVMIQNDQSHLAAKIFFTIFGLIFLLILFEVLLFRAF